VLRVPGNNKLSSFFNLLYVLENSVEEEEGSNSLLLIKCDVGCVNEFENKRKGEKINKQIKKKKKEIPEVDLEPTSNSQWMTVFCSFTQVV
jgi:hypothetical protein